MNARDAVDFPDSASTDGTAVAGSGVPSNRVKCLRRRVCRGDMLHGMGESFSALFVVRLGFLKRLIVSDDGRMQITGFLMPGDVIGLDGIDTGHHQSDVVALDDSEVFVLPFAQWEQWSRSSAYGERLMARTLALQIDRSQELMIMLGTMRAGERLAAFLLDMSERYGTLGYSPSEFVLRMTRQEIGSYLGLKLETISRLLSHLQREGVILVQGRSIALLDLSALWRASGTSPHSRRRAADSILDREGGLRIDPLLGEVGSAGMAGVCRQ